jgi:hypothetical protein
MVVFLAEINKKECKRRQRSVGRQNEKEPKE